MVHPHLRRVDPHQAAAGPLYQPPGETSLQRRDNTLVTEDFLAVGGNVAYINDSFSFINNPRDPDTIYTDAASNFYQPFEPWNPSTLFRGPSALIENEETGHAQAGWGVHPVRRQRGAATRRS